MADSALSLIPEDAFSPTEIAAASEISSAGHAIEVGDLEGQEITGHADSVRNSVLSWISQGRYATAIRELKYYRQLKSQRAGYAAATDVIFDRALSIVESMIVVSESNAKGSLPRSQKQENAYRLGKFFESMKQLMVRLEQIENDMLVRDALAVTWFLKICVICVFVSFFVLAGAEGLSILGKPADVLVADVSDFIFKIFKM